MPWKESTVRAHQLSAGSWRRGSGRYRARRPGTRRGSWRARRAMSVNMTATNALWRRDDIHGDRERRHHREQRAWYSKQRLWRLLSQESFLRGRTSFTAAYGEEHSHEHGRRGEGRMPGRTCRPESEQYAGDAAATLTNAVTGTGGTFAEQAVRRLERNSSQRRHAATAALTKNTVSSQCQLDDTHIQAECRGHYESGRKTASAAAMKMC